MTLFLHITGPNAQALAAEVEAFFAEVIGTPVERRSLPKDDVIYRSDPLAVAALVLAIPGALVATLDLAQRARLGERIDRLRDRLRGKADSADRVSLSGGAGPDLDLIAAPRDAVIDRLEQTSGDRVQSPSGK